MREALVLGLLALFGSVAVVHGQSTEDVVELTNGGRLRGEVLVYEPGRPLLLRLPNGETRTLAPSEVQRVRLGGAPSSASTVPSPPAPRVSPSPLEGSGLGARLGRPFVGPTVAPGRALSPMPAPEGTWRLDDSHRDELPWDDFDPASVYPPSGPFHAGAQLRGGAHIAGQLGSYVELSLFIDLRPAAHGPWRIRLAGALGHFGATQSASLSGRLLLFGFDLGDFFVLRIGPELGATPYLSSWSLFVGPYGELGATLIDKRLEIVLAGGALFAPEGASGATATLGIGGVL